MITKIICAVGVILIIILVLAVLWEKSRTAQRVAMPKFLLILAAALVIGAGWLFFMCWTERNRELLGACIATAVGAVLMLLAYFSLRIDYDESGFTARKYFFRPKHYTYDEILGVDMGIGSYTLVMRSGRVKVDVLATGKTSFYEYAEEKFTANSRHGHIPKIELPSFLSRLTRDNVEAPGEFLFFSVAMSLMNGYCVYDTIRDFRVDYHMECVPLWDVLLDSSRAALALRVVLCAFVIPFIVFASIPFIIRYADKVPFLANLFVKPGYRKYEDGENRKQAKRKRRKRKRH